MVELLNEAVQPANIVYTILMMFSIIYMMSVIIGAFDISSIDIDIDMDLDADIDSDIGLFAGALSFFNFGKIPFMIIYTITVISMWVIAMLLNHYIGKGDIWFAIFTFMPILLVGLIIAKFCTTPLIPIFKNMNQGVEPIDYIGLQGELILPASNKEVGQVEINIEGDIHRIMVKLESENDVLLEKGIKVIIVGFSKNENFYWIEKEDKL